MLAASLVLANMSLQNAFDEVRREWLVRREVDRSARNIEALKLPMELADHHELISAHVLHAGVPREIVLQFETARNVYLYAWFVYRFYPVVEHQCLSAPSIW